MWAKIVPTPVFEDSQSIPLIVVPAGTVTTFAVTKAVCPTEIVGVAVERETVQVGRVTVAVAFPPQEPEGLMAAVAFMVVEPFDWPVTVVGFPGEVTVATLLLPENHKILETVPPFAVVTVAVILVV